jgi:radical SAM protein with 4Fe4S-binding SPASM domain
MSFDNYKIIVDEVGSKLESIFLWNYGEPFLNPEIFNMIKYSKSQNIKTVTSTNGNFLDGKIYQIIDSGVDVLRISLDGASKHTYDEYRRNGDFDKVIKNIKELCHKKNKEIFVELQFIIMKHNEHEVEKIKSLANKIGVDKLSLKSVWFLDKKLRKKYKDLLPENKKYQRKLEQTGFCIRPWYHMTIQWNGDVAPCCYDANCQINLGNVFEEGVMSVWNGKKFKNLRKIMKKQYRGENILKICDKCPELSERRL